MIPSDVRSPAPDVQTSRRGRFQILCADDPAQYTEWLSLWLRWPDAEIMAHPDYVRLFARPGDEALVACYTGPAGGGILYPLILRPLHLEFWAPPGQTGCDLTTPYGYGGPYAWGISPEEAADFWKHYDAWARHREAITTFARLSVYPDQLLPFQGEIVPNGPNFLRRLDLSPEELWNDYEPKVRQNVRRARTRGCSLSVDETGERLEEFHRVYTATMTRHNADPQYFFPIKFFEAIIRTLPRAFAFFHVLHGGRVVSSELVLLSKRHAYFYLGGTLAEAFEVRPNDFLQHETFLWCQDAGKKSLVLGGGYKGSEGLVKYKRSFAPTGEVVFRLGIQTHDPQGARRLIEARKQWEGARGRTWAPEPGYFPVYRAAGQEATPEPAPATSAGP